MAEKVEKRCPNFSEEDINLLINLVKNYSDIIECKKSDTYTWKEKLKCWEEITKQLNTLTGTERNTNSVRQKYKNLKKETKKKFAKQKCETYKTGGGTSTDVGITSLDEEIKEIIGPSVTGLGNTFDSDACENITVIIENETETVGERAEEDNIEDEKENEAKNQGEQINQKNSIGENWEKWTPSLLKSPVSKSLKAPPKMKKGELTRDCRIKINTLSMAKLELMELQKDLLRKDMVIKDKELQMKEEEHGAKMEKHKLEMVLLKKKLETNFM